MVLKQKFTQDDFKVTSKRDLHNGFFSLQEYMVKHRMFAGEWTPELKRELFVRGPATAVLLYDLECDAVVLLEQFRVGAIDYVENPWLFEIVAGINDEGEPPEKVARREAKEEADCEIKKLFHITNYLVSPGATDELVYLYCGLVDTTGVEGIHGLADEFEDIKVHVVDRADAYALVQDGTINNAAAIMALQWLQLNYHDLC